MEAGSKLIGSYSQSSTNYREHLVFGMFSEPCECLYWALQTEVQAALSIKGKSFCRQLISHDITTVKRQDII